MKDLKNSPEYKAIGKKQQKLYGPKIQKLKNLK